LKLIRLLKLLQKEIPLEKNKNTMILIIKKSEQYNDGIF
jgi:hypothetical protein